MNRFDTADKRGQTARRVRALAPLGMTNSTYPCVGRGLAPAAKPQNRIYSSIAQLVEHAAVKLAALQGNLQMKTPLSRRNLSRKIGQRRARDNLSIILCVETLHGVPKSRNRDTVKTKSRLQCENDVVK